MKSETLIKVERNKRKYFESVFNQENISVPALELEPNNSRPAVKIDIFWRSLSNRCNLIFRKIAAPLSDRIKKKYKTFAEILQHKTDNIRDRVFSFLEVLFDV